MKECGWLFKAYRSRPGDEQDAYMNGAKMELKLIWYVLGSLEM